MKNIYLVAGHKTWNKEHFDALADKVEGEWHYISKEEELTPALLEKLNPRYIFFLHWSHIVPQEITERYECVCFHMTDLPYGRGGSPLQNLILRGHKSTMLTALRMDAGLDTGDIYLKAKLSLEGKAEDIYRRASLKSCEMITEIISLNPEPTPQQGEAVVFNRRKPGESEIPMDSDLQKIYDYIRMLDAEGYPHAFVRWGGYTLEFSEATLHNGQIEAKVLFKKGKE